MAELVLKPTRNGSLSLRTNTQLRPIAATSALPFRAGTVSFADLAAHWTIIVNLLLGAWLGAGWAISMKQERLYRVIADDRRLHALCRDSSFAVLKQNSTFVMVMAVGSLVGTFLGGQLLGIVRSGALLSALAAILLMSAVKVWRH